MMCAKLTLVGALGGSVFISSRFNLAITTCHFIIITCIISSSDLFARIGSAIVMQQQQHQRNFTSFPIQAKMNDEVINEFAASPQDAQCSPIHQLNPNQHHYII